MLMNDIIKPDLLWIEGRCYRINGATAETTAFHEHDLYGNDIDFDMDFMAAEGDTDEYEIQELDNNRYKTSFHVSRHYQGSIIGKKGVTKMRIERDTQTQIEVPRPGQSGDIVILGSNAANVKAARRKINIIVISTRMKQKPTHFISFPLRSDELVKNFAEFKAAVIRDCMGQGVEESLFPDVRKLHLTVGVMCLMDNQERTVVSQLLNEAKEKVVMPLLAGHLPLKLNLRGLSYMNDEPTRVHVMYVNVKPASGPPDILQTLTDNLVDHFYRAGFMNNNEHGRTNVKLHMTIMNSKHRAKASSDTNVRGRYQKREPFDASLILEKYSDYDFGTAELNDIHLSVLDTIGPDGYYHSSCSIKVNEPAQ